MLSDDSRALSTSSHGGDTTSDSDRRTIRSSDHGEDGKGSSETAHRSVRGDGEDDFSRSSNRKSPAPASSGVRRTHRRDPVIRSLALCADASTFKRPTTDSSYTPWNKTGTGNLSSSRSTSHSEPSTRQPSKIMFPSTFPREDVSGQLSEEGASSDSELFGTQRYKTVSKPCRSDTCHLLDEAKQKPFGQQCLPSETSMFRLPESPVVYEQNQEAQHCRYRGDFIDILKKEKLGVSFWIEDDIASFDEDCPAFSNNKIPLASIANDLFFCDFKGHLYLYVPESTGTYFLGDSVQTGWENYKSGHNFGWSKFARRIHPVSGGIIDDCSGLEKAYSTLILKNEELLSIETAVVCAAKKLGSLGLVIEKEHALERIKDLLKTEDLEQLQSIIFFVADTGLVEVERRYLKGELEIQLQAMIMDRLTLDDELRQAK